MTTPTITDYLKYANLQMAAATLRTTLRPTHQSTGAAQEAAQPGDFKRWASATP